MILRDEFNKYKKTLANQLRGTWNTIKAAQTAITTLQTKGAKTIISTSTAVAHTGTATETTLFTGTVPANSIGATGTLEFRTLFSATNNANVKTFRIKVNGTTIAQLSLASLASNYSVSRIINRTLSSQIAPATTSNTAAHGSTGTLATYAFNTAANLTITVTMALATTTDTTTLENFTVIAIP
jgi:hypothetical protein